jgi:hypothetical protein
LHWHCPTHWANLVLSSATVQIYIEKQVGTWQSIPNIEIEIGDFSDNNQPLSFSNQNPAGVEDRTVLSNHGKQQLQVSFADQLGIAKAKEINTPIAVSGSSQNQWRMPATIIPDSSGLRCSSRADVLNRRGKVYYIRTTLMNQDVHLHSTRLLKS